MDRPEVALRASLRTPRAAGVAGIIFSLLLGTALVLIRLAAPAGVSEGSATLTDQGTRRSIVIALNLVPFAGIAFLWFIGVIRDRVGDREDRFFATVFLGSGLLFVGMLFVGAAVAGGLLAGAAAPAGSALSTELWDLEQRVISTLLNVYAIRMGAVFILSTTVIGVRTGIIPRWLAMAGYAAAAILLFLVTISPWVNLVMPVWAFVLSVHILVKSRTFEERTDAAPVEPPVG
jgi:MFS family permease